MLNTKILVAQLGARRHYQEPLLFDEWGFLDVFYTDFYAGNGSIAKFLRYPSIVNRLSNTFKKALDRYAPELDQRKVVHFPWFGYQYFQKSKKTKGLDPSSIYIWGAKEFSRRILQRGLGNANIIYGFNGVSLELFQYAKQQGIKCILDQTLAERSLVHQLLLEEDKVWQGWSKSPFTVRDSDLELVQREQQEQAMADCIICGSEFVKESLVARGVNACKISVVSLGRIKESQLFQKIPQHINPKKRGDGLRILFAGEVGLRKGIPYLLEALKQLKEEIPFSCKIAGGIGIKSERVENYSDVCDFLGRVPRSQMAELYAWADVFVLPSICEGSAMVIYEALNWGLPVITTYNAGSIVRDTVDGFIVPIRTLDQIIQRLQIIYSGEHQLNLVQTQQYLKTLKQQSENVLRQSVMV